MKRKYIKKELLLLFCMHGMCLVAGGTFAKKWGEKAFQTASKAASEVKTAAGKAGSATKKAAGSVKTAAESGYSSAVSSAKKAVEKFKRSKAAELKSIEIKEIDHAPSIREKLDDTLFALRVKISGKSKAELAMQDGVELERKFIAAEKKRDKLIEKIMKSKNVMQDITEREEEIVLKEQRKVDKIEKALKKNVKNYERYARAEKQGIPPVE